MPRPDARLADAVKNRDKASVRSLLTQRVDVNAPDVEGMTALHWAAHWDDLDTAKLLLRAGANAKAANRYGVTPLHEACNPRQRRDDRNAAQGRRRSERRVRRRRNAADDGGADRQRGRREDAAHLRRDGERDAKRGAGRRR